MLSVKKKSQNNWCHIVAIYWLITDAQFTCFPLFLYIVSVNIKRYSAWYGEKQDYNMLKPLLNIHLLHFLSNLPGYQNIYHWWKKIIINVTPIKYPFIISPNYSSDYHNGLFKAGLQKNTCQDQRWLVLVS